MGIKALNPFIEKHAPETFRTVDASVFRGTRVAIDAPLWAYAQFSIVCKNILRDLPLEKLLLAEPFDEAASVDARLRVHASARTFAQRLMLLGITPVFVFDGTCAPEKMHKARARRAVGREATDRRISELCKQIQDVGVGQHAPRDVDDLRRLRAQRPPFSPAIEAPLLREYLRAAGLPTLVAPDEAERMCAHLAAVGLASASWTGDTDSYAFGAPLFITDFDRSASSDNPRLLVTAPPIAMRKLGLTREQFTDFCIMCGCDFNEGMPNIGAARAYKILERAREREPKAQRLIELAASIMTEEGSSGVLGKLAADLPWEILNAERCREIFLSRDDLEAATAALTLDNLNVRLEVAVQAVGPDATRAVAAIGAHNVEICM